MSERGDYQEWSRLAKRLSGMVFLQLLLMIHSFGRPLSQLATSRMGQTAVCMGKGTALGKRDTTLPHRQTFTRKIIPATDKRLDEENMERLNLPQTTWIETFLEGVTDKSTGLPLFSSELAWFAYKVSGVMCSASACEHCWSVEGWIHS